MSLTLQIKCVFFAFQLQKLLILRCFRADRLLPAIRNYIKSTIGEEFLISPVVDFNQIFASFAANVPILCVYPTDGMDAMHQILRLSHNYHGANIISIDHTANDVRKFLSSKIFVEAFALK